MLYELQACGVHNARRDNLLLGKTILTEYTLVQDLDQFVPWQVRLFYRCYCWYPRSLSGAFYKPLRPGSDFSGPGVLTGILKAERR